MNLIGMFELPYLELSVFFYFMRNSLLGQKSEGVGKRDFQTTHLKFMKVNKTRQQAVCSLSCFPSIMWHQGS